MMEKWTHCVLGLTNSWHMAVVMLTKPSLLLVQILTINEITSQWNANFPRNDPGRSLGHGRAATTIPPSHRRQSARVRRSSRPSHVLSYCDLTLAWTQLKLGGYHCGELLAWGTLWCRLWCYWACECCIQCGFWFSSDTYKRHMWELLIVRMTTIVQIVLTLHIYRRK